MGIDVDELPTLLAGLSANEWSRVLDAVARADRWLRVATPGDLRVDTVAGAIAALADHPKWEIRRAVAHTASHCLNRAFEAPLVRLAVDDNARVRQATEQAALRRRDGRQASLLGKQHENHINSVLEDIEARFGVRGRAAVRRAADEIASVFARELYHEVIKLLTPLAVSANRLKKVVGEDAAIVGAAHAEIERIDRQVRQLQSVINAMRSYTSTPRLAFTSEEIGELVDEAWSLASSARPAGSIPPIEVEIPSEVIAPVCRTRLIQALTNVLVNAIEAYDGKLSLAPIRVAAESRDGFVVVRVIDAGAGMSSEAVVDARTLFSTSKPNGTGFGLPLAIKIVEVEHRGRLTIRSEIDRGCEIEIVLPLNGAMSDI